MRIISIGTTGGGGAVGTLSLHCDMQEEVMPPQKVASFSESIATQCDTAALKVSP